MKKWRRFLGSESIEKKDMGSGGSRCYAHNLSSPQLETVRPDIEYEDIQQEDTRKVEDIEGRRAVEDKKENHFLAKTQDRTNQIIVKKDNNNWGNRDSIAQGRKITILKNWLRANLVFEKDSFLLIKDIFNLFEKYIYQEAMPFEISKILFSRTLKTMIEEEDNWQPKKIYLKRRSEGIALVGIYLAENTNKDISSNIFQAEGKTN